MFILFVVNSLEYLLTKTSFCKVGEFLFNLKPVFKQKEFWESFMSWDVIFNSLLNKCYCNIVLINFWLSLQFLVSKIFLLSRSVLGNLPVHVLQLKFWKRWTGQFPSCPSISLFLQVATEHPPPPLPEFPKVLVQYFKNSHVKFICYFMFWFIFH